MNNMPKKLREECARDPFFAICARNRALYDHECKPNPMTGKLIEWDHAIIFGANQVQKKFAIVPTCWWAHSGPGFSRSINQWIALNRATDRELIEISKAVDWFRIRANLNKKYGPYNMPDMTNRYIQVLYPWLVGEKQS